VAIAPSGDLAFVAQGSQRGDELRPSATGALLTARLDGSCGALTRVDTRALAATSHPTSLAVHPSGRFTYLSDNDRDERRLWGWTVDSAGRLGDIPSLPQSQGEERLTCAQLAVDPGRHVLYTSAGRTLEGFTIDATSGKLGARTVLAGFDSDVTGIAVVGG
jgi:hypothetical protein